MRPGALQVPAASIAEVASPRARAVAGSRSLAAGCLSAAGLAVLLLVGCEPPDPVAGLEELPAEMARSLRAAADLPVLATAVDPTDPVPPPTESPQALCAADASRRILDARVTTPIVVCTREEDPAAAGCVLWPGRSARSTSKLTDLGVVGDLGDAVVWQPPLRCETSDGPWNAILTIERFCFGTCAPLNTLIVVGVPNNVSFAWWGAVENHPDGFDFVGEPVLKTTTTQPCHPQNGGDGGPIL
jgi:hypothetical protein